jgi:hypothetical protein
MNNIRLLALACLASTVAAAGPFDQFKGKMKEGMYEYKMEMDMGQMPGMPPGMSPKQNMSFQKCLTAQDIEKGEMGRGARDGKMPENCEVRNFNMSGNTATYTMECKGERPMKADNKITFASDGYKMDMKMQMTQGGQAMNMAQHMEAKYLGPCK